jgi:hypothetical protein
MMFKSITVMVAPILFGVIISPTASAGTYCDDLGSNPSISTAQQVILDAVLADDSEGIANDIVENCPEQYGIIMEAGDQLLEQMGG